MHRTRTRLQTLHQAWQRSNVSTETKIRFKTSGRLRDALLSGYRFLRGPGPMMTRLSNVLCVLCSSFSVVSSGDEKPLTWADFHAGLSRTFARQPVPWTSQPFGHKTTAQGMRFGQRFLVSYDEGASWSQTVYELYHGGLYANSVVLDDVTVHDNRDAGQRHLNVLR